MDNEIFQREEILLGKEKLQKLQQKNVAVLGSGGVGSQVIEGLARAGICNFILVDFDKVEKTNINRQIIATNEVLGKYKVDVAEKRLMDINKDIVVKKYIEFIGKENENKELFDELKQVDYIVDAIDTVSAKIRIIEFAKNNNIKIISALGTGNKLNPTMLKLDNISKTKVCPLAKIIRKELKKRNIYSLDVVYSEENPVKTENSTNIGSISYVPSIAGLLICYKIVNEFIK